MTLRIRIATPDPAGTAASGNPMTALRWAAILASLGHDARVVSAWEGDEADVLVALHARRSAGSVERWSAARPGSPAIVALTGTDLYVDGPAHPVVRRTLELATRIVVLQRAALADLLPAAAAKAVVIHQSAEPSADRPPLPRDAFQVAVVGHLREVKDPFLAAEASRLLPARSRVRIVHVGKALSEEMSARARVEQGSNPRYRWLGERPYPETRRILAGSHLAAVTSRAEGSSNVLSEALVDGVPVVATRIPGLVGTLGDDHPGLFEPGDAAGLARVLLLAEEDPAFLAALRLSGARCAELVRPDREREAWRALLAGLVVSGGTAE